MILFSKQHRNLSQTLGCVLGKKADCLTCKIFDSPGFCCSEVAVDALQLHYLVRWFLSRSWWLRASGSRFCENASEIGIVVFALQGDPRAWL